MMLQSPPLKIVAKEDLHRIHEQTLRVLAKTGVAFHLQEALAIFRDNGATVENGTVLIPPEMVENALRNVPQQFTWHARNPDNNIEVGPEQSRVHVMLNHGPVNIQDIENGRRRSTTEDLANLYKLGQASDVCNVIGQVPVDPSDADSLVKHLVVTHKLLQHTDKPLMSYPVDNRRQTEDIFTMVEMAMGRDYLDDHPAIGTSVCALSPLKYAPESCDTLIGYARRNQVAMALTCAMSGVTAPINPIGTVIMQNAEILAGLVLTQLVNPGTPFIYSPASAVPNMKNGAYITGSPESNLINIVGLQLGRELYKIPTRTMAGLTDAKTVDCQAGYETMQNLFTLMLGGTNMINECIGTLDAIMTVSYEKFIIDQEMIGRLMRIMEGVATEDEDFDISAIEEMGQSGCYLMHPSTLKKCRSMWTPAVSDWSSFSDWQKAGESDVVVRANRKYKEILAACPESMISSELDQELRAFVESKK
ncbi:trimethylamine methyltransferase family protein [Desulforhopalus singaporensis]|uniref:Methyltransferase n=1 Tax=Desulforhopalus singaporensis TaxID=91360 RepID=A0A1H0LX02_9BACT|nr:trimethylamine methyltransferase family protein [Desulforhopalus singaporensis]SDO72516.1 trimethylamine---corrinoid protein Co-methyltransferase [Desulforhopalus singaporensis]